MVSIDSNWNNFKPFFFFNNNNSNNNNYHVGPDELLVFEHDALPGRDGRATPAREGGPGGVHRGPELIGSGERDPGHHLLRRLRHGHIDICPGHITSAQLSIDS